MKQTYRLVSHAQRRVAQAVIDRIAALPVSKFKHGDVEKFAPLVIAIFEGVEQRVFEMIDDQGGNARLPEDAGKNFWLVRTVRNNFDWSKQLRAVLSSAPSRGDALASKLVAGVTSMAHLLSKWTEHHYRPTLRADAGPEYVELADLYDAAARAADIPVQAFR